MLERPKRGGGTKPKYDWEAIEAGFHIMACLDDVSRSSNPNKSHYARALTEWAQARFGEENTPDEATIRAKLPEWLETYYRASENK